MNCARCEAVLSPVFPLDEQRAEESGQFDNALEILFRGGYGMFLDTMVGFGGEDPRVLLCENCSCEFVQTNPWIVPFIEPYK
jgi:hypothetical protein